MLLTTDTCQLLTEKMNICIYGAASTEIDDIYIKETERLASVLAARGHDLVFGAGTNGLMGAAARGFYAGGRKIYGVVPEFFNVDGILFPDCTELIRTKTMRERKQIMDDLSQAFITCPGGIGTYEEVFEILTLKQLCQTKRPLVIYDINGYFAPFRAMLENCVEQGFMPKATMRLMEFISDPEECADYLENYVEPTFSVDEVRYVSNAENT